MAGLWDDWKNVDTKERLLSCTILITDANRFVAEVHDRIPVFCGPSSSMRGSTAQWACTRSRRQSRMTICVAAG